MFKEYLKAALMTVGGPRSAGKITAADIDDLPRSANVQLPEEEVRRRFVAAMQQWEDPEPIENLLDSLTQQEREAPSAD